MTAKGIRADGIAQISKMTGLRPEEIRLVFRAILRLIRHRPVIIWGFGAFKLTEQKRKRYRTPFVRGGKPGTIKEPRFTIRFKCSGALRRTLAGKARAPGMVRGNLSMYYEDGRRLYEKKAIDRTKKEEGENGQGN